MSNDHTAGLSSSDEVKEPKLRFAIALTSVIFLVEVIGGWWTGSLALLSDAGHVFGDVFALVLALVAFRLSLRAPDEHHTFGLHRAEVFAALINGLSLLVIAGIIFHRSYHRLLQPAEVKSTAMLIIAVIGLAVNAVVLLRLRGHGDDINLRGAYLHVMGDLLASVGVVVAAVLIALTGQHIIDPIISAAIGLLILISAVRISRESVYILLESVPRGVDLNEIAQALTSLDEVTGVHHIHAWSLCSTYTAISAHVTATVSDPQQQRQVHLTVEDILKRRFGFSETTIEMEVRPESTEPLVFPATHPAEAEGHQP